MYIYGGFFIVVLPIGMDVKLPSFPFITVSIVTLTVLYSYFSFSKLNKNIDYMFNSRASVSYAKKARDYLLVECTKPKSEFSCLEIKKIPAVFYNPFIMEAKLKIKSYRLSLKLLTNEALKTKNPSLYSLKLDLLNKQKNILKKTTF